MTWMVVSIDSCRLEALVTFTLTVYLIYIIIFITISISKTLSLIPTFYQYLRVSDSSTGSTTVVNRALNWHRIAT